MLGQKLSQQWYSAPYGVQSTAPDLHRFPSRSWPVSCKGRSYAMGHLSSSSGLIASLRLTVEQILSSALVLINAALNRSIRTDHLTTYYFHTEYEVHVLTSWLVQWMTYPVPCTRKHTYSLSLSLSPEYTCILVHMEYIQSTEYSIYIRSWSLLHKAAYSVYQLPHTKDLHLPTSPGSPPFQKLSCSWMTWLEAVNTAGNWSKIILVNA